jgi:hypothetical protein
MSKELNPRIEVNPDPTPEQAKQNPFIPKLKSLDDYHHSDHLVDEAVAKPIIEALRHRVPNLTVEE